ncbi:MAG: hypothetical protein Q8K81_06765 [Sulfuricurvum sp.]|nr:hypothetical protein [Sulfuricurvum sp.]
MSKEDKFIYLSILAELIQALDHDYRNDERYVIETGKKPLNETTILGLISKYNPNLDEHAQGWVTKTIQEIDDDLQRAKKNTLLNTEERDVLVNNIAISRPCRIQRSMNKSVYYAGVTALAFIIQQGKIQYIIAPMYPKFLHVLHSLQGALRSLHPQIDSIIDIYEDQGHLLVQLKIQGSR